MLASETLKHESNIVWNTYAALSNISQHLESAGPARPEVPVPARRCLEGKRPPRCEDECGHPSASASPLHTKKLLGTGRGLCPESLCRGVNMEVSR